jgi:hypothetical protein
MIEVMIRWPINPFRGERFAEEWLPVAEAVLDYGATEWAFTRAIDGRLDFIQTALFPSKEAFEQYWYSEEVSQKRVEIAGIYQVPLVPTFWEVLGAGEAEEFSPVPRAPS